MKKGIYILPNSITLCGMFMGFFAIISAFQGKFVLAAWSIIIAGVFDGMDGWVARFTNSTSKFGIELDSLSDAIAFGVAPACLLYMWALKPFGRLGMAVAFLFTACGAMRLARFNVQMGSSEKKSFTGMPIPAAAAFVSAVLIFSREVDWSPRKSVTLLIMTIVLALLMVSTLRFHGLKEIDFNKRKPFWILVVFAAFMALLIMHPAMTLFVVAVLYLSVAIIENSYLFIRDRGQAKTPAA